MKKARTWRYRIGHGEDCECDYCGWPLDRGDTAIAIESDDYCATVCCPSHATKLVDRRQEAAA